MTVAAFRRLALALPQAEERAHMGHPDFRANGRIFATLSADGTRGMVKLTPDQQRDLLRERSDAFAPEAGAWGRSGCTRVHLALVDEEALGAAMTLAWQNTVRRAPRPQPSRPPGSTRRR